jgi:hypothetical protein
MTKRIAITTFALLCVAATASAAPLVPPGNSPVYFQFNNIEQVNPLNSLVVPGYVGDGSCTAASPCGNWGLFNISSVQNGFALPVPPHNDIAGGPTFFSDDGPGGTAGQITGIFYGIDFTSPTTATGGTIDLYWQDAGADTIDASCLAGVGCLPDAAAVARFTAGTFLGRLFLAPGVIPGDAATTLTSTINPATQGGSGHADAFADADTSPAGTGFWTDFLDGDWFWVDVDGDTIRGEAGEIRDVRFSTFFNVDLDSWDAGPAGTEGLRSNDPARVFTAPEPMTLGLLGLGLAAFAYRQRRRTV